MTVTVPDAVAAEPRPAARIAHPAAAPTRPPVLIVPGLYNSGPDHWQTYWQGVIPDAERVDQFDWEHPALGDWTASLAEAVRRRPGAVLVAHSLGCALVAHYAAVSGGRNIGGAFLVAPADVSRDRPAGPLLQGFSPMPDQKLPFPSMVVASRDDPYVSIERANVFATAWGSTLVDLGMAGHINVDSGHRRWESGLALLEALIVQMPKLTGVALGAEQAMAN